MTERIGHGIPQASLREEWSVSSVQRLAWAMGRPSDAQTVPDAATRAAAREVAHEAGPSGAVPHDPVRRARLMSALRRLAADPGATPAERALALGRLMTMTGASYSAAS